MDDIKLPDAVVKMLKSIDPMRHMFEQKKSRIPVPALSAKAPALLKFKEGLLGGSGSVGQSAGSASQTTTEGKGKNPSTSMFDEIDPVLGDLTEYYEKMLNFNDS